MARVAEMYETDLRERAPSLYERAKGGLPVDLRAADIRREYRDAAGRDVEDRRLPVMPCGIRGLPDAGAERNALDTLARLF